MTRGVFITGTDTDAGKTHASVALLRTLREHRLRAVGMKPVASGCVRGVQGLRSSDAEQLIAASAPRPPYVDCNPFAFEPPIAPHIAAREAGIAIDLDAIAAAYARLARGADRVVVEGVGGWAVPYSATTMQVDLVRRLQLPVILVVGLRVGCISHALLGVRAIVDDGCALAGWIANRIDPAMTHVDDNIACLRARIDAPHLGTLPYGSPGVDALDVSTL